MEIDTVHTENAIYYTRSKVIPEHQSNKVKVFDCTMNKTDYGSVLIIRSTSNPVEIYPSKIHTIVYKNK